MSRPSISVLIHTRNEERWIAGCIGSCQWADEVVIADMGSTDRTREIATGLGARIVDVPLVKYVDEVRNQAMEACRSEWLLVVDADELVSPGLRARIEATVGSAATADAYWLPRRNYLFDTWIQSGMWPDAQLRLFRRGAAKWTGIVHEAAVVTGTVGNFPEEPEAALEHPGWCHDMGKFLAKHERYAALEVARMDYVGDADVVIQLLRRPASEFLGRYLGGAWRHGLAGLVFSLLMTAYQLMIVLHLWAARRQRVGEVAPAVMRRKVRMEFLRTAVKAWRW